MINSIKKLHHFANRHELLLLLLLLTTVLRLPSLYEPLWYGDENIYLAIGQAMRMGRTLYSTVIDYPNKPPLIYIFASLSQTVSVFRFLLLIWSMFTTAFFFALAKRFTNSTTALTIASLVFILATSTPYYEANIANSEIFFITPILLGLIFLTNKPTTKLITTKPLNHLLAGIALGFAFLFKIHVALDIAAIGLFFYIFPHKFSLKLPLKLIKDKKLLSFLFGTSIPIVLILVFYASKGVSPLSLFLTAAGSSQYVSVWGNQEIFLQTIGLGSLQSRLVLLILITLVIFKLKSRLHPATTLIFTWSVFTLFAALLSARNYPHYLIQAMPPLTLGLVIYLSISKRLDKLVLLTAYLLFLGAFYRFDFYHYPVVSYYKNFIAYSTGQIETNEYYRRFDGRMPRNYKLAEYIRQLTGPEDQIYIWGTEPGVYVLANRLQVEKLVVSFHVADLDYYQQTITSLEEELPRVIVVMESEKRDFKALERLLATSYNQITQIGDPDKSPQENIGSRAFVYKLKQPHPSKP